MVDLLTGTQISSESKTLRTCCFFSDETGGSGKDWSGAGAVLAGEVVGAVEEGDGVVEKEMGGSEGPPISSLQKSRRSSMARKSGWSSSGSGKGLGVAAMEGEAGLVMDKGNEEEGEGCDVYGGFSLPLRST